MLQALPACVAGTGPGMLCCAVAHCRYRVLSRCDLQVGDVGPHFSYISLVLYVGRHFHILQVIVGIIGLYFTCIFTCIFHFPRFHPY